MRCCPAECAPSEGIGEEFETRPSRGPNAALRVYPTMRHELGRSAERPSKSPGSRRFVAERLSTRSGLSHRKSRVRSRRSRELRRRPRGFVAEMTDASETGSDQTAQEQGMGEGEL